MTEEEKQPMRRIDVTQDGRTERLFALQGDDPKWWALYSPSDWMCFLAADWTIHEDDDGEKIYFQGQPPIPGANWKWIDDAPTLDAAEELEKTYDKQWAERYGEDPDD